MQFIIESNRIYSTDPQGKLLAEISFPACEPGVVDINRTFVDESLRGQGVAGKLMATLIETLRADGRKARASCSYAVRWFENHPEAADLLCDSDDGSFA